MNYKLIAAFLFLSIHPIFSQDSLQLESVLSVDIRAKHILTALTENPIECISCLTGLVDDNPLSHMAIYSGINYKATLAGKHSFETGLYMEERSFSGGNNTLSNLIVFPKIVLSSKSTFSIGNNLFNYELKGGDFWDEDFDDILRIYNIDIQGLKVKFGYKKFKLGFYVISDLSKNIGFDLHEMYKLTAEYHETKFNNTFSMSVNELHDAPRGNHPDPRDFNLANYSEFKMFDNLIAETQIELRTNSVDKFALAIGGKISYQKDNLALTTGLRYYQAAFNKGYRSFTPQYRQSRSYIGTQLYPLKNYYRPINQWALMTSYQGRDILNYELRVNWDKKLHKKLYLSTEIDFNLIYNLTLGRVAYYPLYNVGLDCKFFKSFVLSLTATNKHMTLDNFYQTSYASKLPFLSYSFRMNLADIPLKTVNLCGR